MDEEIQSLRTGLCWMAWAMGQVLITGESSFIPADQGDSHLTGPIWGENIQEACGTDRCDSQELVLLRKCHVKIYIS